MCAQSCANILRYGVDISFLAECESLKRVCAIENPLPFASPTIQAVEYLHVKVGGFWFGSHEGCALALGHPTECFEKLLLLMDVLFVQSLLLVIIKRRGKANPVIAECDG